MFLLFSPFPSSLFLFYFSSSSSLLTQVRFENVERLCEMGSNIDVVTSKAECCLYEQNPQRAYELTTWVRDRDPYNLRCASVHVSALVELGHKSELFYCAHNLVSAYPERAISWYAVACYYYIIGKFELARRYFSKATTKERQFAPAWIGFGNSFAAQDESDQAMAAYRTAQRLFPGSHVPLLCTGMEYLRTNNMALSQTYFNQALKMCPNDPLVCVLYSSFFLFVQVLTLFLFLFRNINFCYLFPISPSPPPSLSQLQRTRRRPFQTQRVRAGRGVLQASAGTLQTFAADSHADVGGYVLQSWALLPKARPSP